MTNVVVAEGYIQKRPEMKRVGEKRTALLTFSLVNTTGFGEYKHTNFFDCEIWGKFAEAMADHLDEGSRVTLTGTMYHNRFTGSDGNKKQKWILKVSELSFGGGNQQRTEQRDRATPAEPQAKSYGSAFNEFDDSEVPF